LSVYLVPLFKVLDLSQGFLLRSPWRCSVIV